MIALSSCSGIFHVRRNYYAIDGSKHSEFVLKTKNYNANDFIEAKLEQMKYRGDILNFNRLDRQQITSFKILFSSKDSIKLKSLLLYTSPLNSKKIMEVSANPEFLLLCKMDEKTDTVYYKNGSKILINKFRNRTKKFLGYKFYPY